MLKPSSEFSERTYGILPDGSKVRRIDTDTKTHVNYGVKTWSETEAVRDILQNHLDANDDRFFFTLLDAFVDLNEFKKKQAEAPESADVLSRHLNEFGYLLLRYKKTFGHLTPEGRDETLDALGKFAGILPLKAELQGQGGLDRSVVAKKLDVVNEQLPLIEHRVQDKNVPDQGGVWVSEEELSQGIYQEKIGDFDWRFTLTDTRISDEGAGFDHKLCSFYKSTKAGQKHLRGKFGEGYKMSMAAILRASASIRMRSAQILNNGQQALRKWRQQAVIGKDGHIHFKGVEIQTPWTGEKFPGSSTSIRLTKEVGGNLRYMLDPREGKCSIFSRICLDYDSDRFTYPVAMTDAAMAPAGVSLTGSPGSQYLNGLLIESQRDEIFKDLVLFSYDFQDPQILEGRDRNRINHSALQKQLFFFWSRAEKTELLESLVKRVLETEVDRNGDKNLEFQVLEHLLSETPDEKAPAAVHRTYQNLFAAIPKVLELKEGQRYVFLKQEGCNQDVFKKNSERLIKHGYCPLKVTRELSAHAITQFNEAYRGQLILLDSQQALAEIEKMELAEALGSPDLLSVHQLYREAKDLLAAFGGHEQARETEEYDDEEGDENEDRFIDINALGEPILVKSSSPKNEPVKLSTVDGKKRLVLHYDLIAEDIKKQGDYYWKVRLPLEILAAGFMVDSEFRNPLEGLSKAQQVVDRLLDRSVREDHADLAQVPDDFGHTPQLKKAVSNELWDTEKMRQAHMEFISLSALETHDLSLDEFEKFVNLSSEFLKSSCNALIWLIRFRIIVEDGVAGYVDYSGEKPVFVRKKLEECPVIEEINIGSFGLESFERIPVYQVDRFRVAPWNLPEGTIMDYKDCHTKQVVLHQGYQIHIGAGRVASTPFELDDRLHIGKGCVYRADENRMADHRCRITLPSSETGPSDMQSSDGVIETPLALEYGKDQWNNPKRIFQDIVQNHLDAGAVELLFEVMRQGQRCWISEEQFEESDQILGIAFADNGKGYSPDELGTMGATTKINPFFRGKYGEGQKLIAATAARHGFELTFSSFGRYRKKIRSWSASVGSQEEELVIRGEEQNEKRVIFHLTSRPKRPGLPRVTTTLLRLPEDAKPTADWIEWMKVVDPRIKNKQGHGGLGRYCLDIRRNQDSIVECGPVRVILDEQGIVYENGLLVKEGLSTALSYDVAEVLENRERTCINYARLLSYIQFVMSRVPDVRVPMKLVECLAREHKDLGLEDETFYSQILEFRLQRTLAKDLPNRHFWAMAHQVIMPEYFVFSEEAVEAKLLEENVSPKKREKLMKTLTSLHHIPPSQRLNVGADEYELWAKLFPSAEDYVKQLGDTEIPVSQETLDKLRKVISSGADVVRNWAGAHCDGSLSQQVFMDAMMSGKRPGQMNEKDLQESRTKWLEMQKSFEGWQSGDVGKSVFVTPPSSRFHAVVTPNRMGVNENLIVGSDKKKLVGTVRHELVHCLTGLRDYDIHFLMCLFDMANSGCVKAQGQ